MASTPLGELLCPVLRHTQRRLRAAGTTLDTAIAQRTGAVRTRADTGHGSKGAADDANRNESQSSNGTEKKGHRLDDDEQKEEQNAKATGKEEEIRKKIIARSNVQPLIARHENPEMLTRELAQTATEEEKELLREIEEDYIANKPFSQKAMDYICIFIIPNNSIISTTINDNIHFYLFVIFLSFSFFQMFFHSFISFSPFLPFHSPHVVPSPLRSAECVRTHTHGGHGGCCCCC